MEQIVSTLYQDPDIKIEKNLRLAAIGSTRKREIDILASQKDIVLAVIECKNYNKVIDVELIDAFFGKLDDIGIPTEKGIFVSIKGFTEGAVERAQKAKIKTLTLSGLSKNRLSVKSGNALEFIVFLLPEVANVSIRYEKSIPHALPRAPFLCDASGKIRGSLFDFIWKEWIEGKPVSTIGEHNVNIDLLDGYYMPIGNGLKQLKKVISINSVVQVTGLVISATGTSKEHLLINQANKQIERFYKNATFNQPKGVQEVISFKTEIDLQDFFNRQSAAIKIAIGRNRLPRIKATSLYWPLSKRTFNEVIQAYKRYQANILPEFDISKLTYIEGSDLKTVWEPVWDKNPILNEISKK